MTIHYTRLNRIHNLFPILLIMGFVLPICNLKAQAPIDARGKHFIFSIPPNFHNHYQEDLENLIDPFSYASEDSIYIYITCDKPTNGTIEFYNGNVRVHSRDFSITNPDIIYKESLRYLKCELLGFNESGTIATVRNDTEIPKKFYFEITSDDSVTVYLLNQATTTSDAMLCLPVNVLGTEYYVMSYNSDGTYWPGYPGEIYPQSTPSQFLVVAVEDGTEIYINQSARTRYHGLMPFAVTLNKGDSYLVQADINEYELNNDLTGSKIESTKPVAVFGSHQRATIPYDNNYGNPSRDYLLEQMPPLVNWGKSAFITPFKQPPMVISEGDDLFRVLAAYDDTEIFLNGVSLGILNSGEYYEGILDMPGEITANGPIIVGQFKKTSQSDGGNLSGDPMMIVVPPKEQFLNKYRVINAQSMENNSIVYTLQYLTLITRTTNINNITIDGVPVPGTLFSEITGTEYSYANPRVSDGTHNVESQEPFGIYVYGYGYANSYGYLGGMGFAEYDLKAPDIHFSRGCYEVSGIITDSAKHDAGVREVDAPEDKRINTDVTIDEFTPYADSVEYHARLIDKRHDGSFTISASDSAGSNRKLDIDIPGFTVMVTGGSVDSLPTFKGEIRMRKELCSEVTFTNYGKFPQTVRSVRNMNTDKYFIKNPGVPFTLQPGEEKRLDVCFYSNEMGLFRDTLIIGDECDDFDVAYLEMSATDDRNSPRHYIYTGRCNDSLRFTFTDSLITDFGIEKIDIIDTLNCMVSVDSINTQVANLSLTVNDRYKDAIYHIIAVDSSGLASELSDTIQGFTVSFYSMDDKQPVLDFGRNYIGDITCDSFEIFNYGLLPFEIRDIFVEKNILFSIPESQFPITIPPGGSRFLSVCFRPNKSDSLAYTDSLDLEFNCMEMRVPVKGIGVEFEGNGNTRCNIPVNIVVNKLSDQYLIEQSFPNPITGNTGKLRFSVPAKSSVNIDLYNSAGMNVSKILSRELPAGVYEIDFSVKDLPNGIYFYVMSAGGKRISRNMVISR